MYTEFYVLILVLYIYFNKKFKAKEVLMTFWTFYIPWSLKKMSALVSYWLPMSQTSNLF